MAGHDEQHAAGGHSHGPRPGSAAAEHVRPLAIAFGLTGAYMLVEVVAGLLTGSLALLSDLWLLNKFIMFWTYG